MKKLVARLKEPSSWGAIFTALAAVGLSLDAGLVQNITAAGAGLAGLVSFVLPEKSAS